MPEVYDDLKMLLVSTCEIPNYILGIPTKTRVAKVIVKALIHRVICILAPLNF